LLTQSNFLFLLKPLHFRWFKVDYFAQLLAAACVELGSPFLCNSRTNQILECDAVIENCTPNLFRYLLQLNGKSHILQEKYGRRNFGNSQWLCMIGAE
jgi:hypothetical protein